MPGVHAFPKHGYLGLLLIAVGWPIAWLKPNGIQFVWENAFFLLWVGYSLTVDGLNYKHHGSSFLSRNPRAYLGMFILSIPCWWLFEFLNQFLQNWQYIYNRPVGSMEHALRASVHFSIVTPAVLGTAELWASSKLLAKSSRKSDLILSHRRLSNYLILGIFMLTCVIGFPRFSFPLVWVCLYLILDSINQLRGLKSLLSYAERGNWRPFFALPLGALTCGFFWEMWNYYASPKWIYTIPFVNFGHLFEMPALGYLGYLPFGLEVYALYILLLDQPLIRSLKINGGEEYFRL
jgi:hypothetical protein